MDYFSELLVELSSRLPELEWKISKLSHTISRHNLPRGLFNPGVELTSASCIAEVKADIYALSQHQNERSAHYLAERIKQKINVLVTLCQINSRKYKTEEKTSFGLTMLSTRQQWIQNLEKDIETLTVQQQSMNNALSNMKSDINPVVILSLKAELGEVERRLTLAKEKLAQAIL